MQLGHSGRRHCSTSLQSLTFTTEVGDGFGGVINAVVFSMIHFLFELITPREVAIGLQLKRGAVRL